MMDPHEYDRLGKKATTLDITPDELDQWRAESDRRAFVLTAYVDEELAEKPLGGCPACGYTEVIVTPVVAQMSAAVRCAVCNSTRKLYANIGEPG